VQIDEEQPDIVGKSTVRLLLQQRPSRSTPSTTVEIFCGDGTKISVPEADARLCKTLCNILDDVASEGCEVQHGIVGVPCHPDISTAVCRQTSLFSCLI
jgi:hypothetical protein